MKMQMVNKHNRARFSFVLVTILVVAFMGNAQALSIVDAKLQELDDQTVLTLQLDQPMNQKLGLFRMANPARQVLDFSSELSNKTLPVEFANDSRIKRSQLIAAGGKSRLVFELAQSYEVQATQSEQSIQIVFSGPKPFVPGNTQAAVLPQGSMLKKTVAEVLGKPAVMQDGAVLNDWRVTEQNGRQVLRMVFDRSDILADAVLTNERLRIRFANARIQPDVVKQLQTAAGAPIAQVELFPGDQALVVQMNLNKATHLLRQSGSVVEVEVTPIQLAAPKTNSVSITPAAKNQSAVARYNGRPITLDFKDADIRTVMQVFADFTKMNLVLSDSVQGTVTVFLKDVPWDQALDIVMRSKGLVSSQSGNVLLVSTPADVSNDQFQTANRRAQDDMEPLVSQVFQVSYQKTADLVTLIKSEDSKLLSDRGTLISDERTSQIFVQDTPTRLERINMIITGLDKPVKQVMIEARVVLADTSVSKDLGVRIQSASARADAFTEVGDQFGSKGFVDTGPLASTTLAYTLFNASSTRLINLQLRALETDNKIRTVSNPRVITSNKEPALIEQGTEIPYQIATSSGATATEFKEANLKLAVTPQIAPDGTVLLDVDIAKDSIGITTANGPAIDTRRVKTKVLVADGGTVVLGGIFEEDDNVLNEKVPFLGDIPGLGALFKGKTDTKRRAELLIFLTPVVLADQ
ncbi:type IV pilus secretin PilQ [Limnobacter parvus]|uniref:Type IV pilus secretin PilQ n=1 Tax=Limnobacter parvus TaxID=2939690 RepID=A0ABT1XF94_9BURK|nr:type IV pilus secretin PilQ [Limnobacter parvus]MCR2745942.1 type IV pilus secretin PilQ [Limnobacter parvus]